MAEEGQPEAKPSFPTMDLYVARSAPDQKHKNTAVARVTTLKVVDEENKPLKDEKYAIYQGKKKDEGTLDGDGLATFYTVDPAEPFRFEVAGRVCLIRKGAYLVDTGKEETEYGGTLVDWTLAEAAVDGDADTKFWSHYDRILKDDESWRKDAKAAPRVVTLWQHDHITRRDIAIRPSFVNVEKAEIQARPIRIRVGPILRHTDATSASIWVETETPALVRVLCGKSGGSDPKSGGGKDVEGLSGLKKGWGATVRVGGRHFAMVEVTGLEENTLYDYSLSLCPPPALGDIPGGTAIEMFFRQKPADAIKKDIEAQLSAVSYSGNPQLTFRTLKKAYDKEIQFLYGSCRVMAYDVWTEGGAAVPDQLEELAGSMASFPAFTIFGGDQIYADSIGVKTRKRIQQERFAARVPGPQPKDDKQKNLLGGAFAGRFAHRLHERAEVSAAHAKIQARAFTVKAVLMSVAKDLFELFKKNWGKHFAAWEAKDKVELFHTLARAKNASAVVNRKYITDFLQADKFQMEQKLAIANDVLWNIPDAPEDLPTVEKLGAFTPDGAPHGPDGFEGVHAGDFAEYAYLYECAWGQPGSNLRKLLASVPIYTMFDDHDMTGRWNTSSRWVEMLKSDKDEWGHWPGTLSDGLAAYLCYQHWGNVGSRSDEQTGVLKKAQKSGKDALPELRKLLEPNVTKSPGSLRWHYEIPVEQPVFLLADTRTKRSLPKAASADKAIDWAKTKQLDGGQLGWMESALKKSKGPAAFVLFPQPMLMPRFASFAMQYLSGLAYIGSQAEGDSMAETLFGALLGASMYLNSFNFYEDLDSWDKTKGHLQDAAKGGASHDDAGRAAANFEHFNSDQTWDDVKGMLEKLNGSAVKTITLLSGDIHFSFPMLGHVGQQPVGELPVLKQRHPHLLQLVSSGFSTSISEKASDILKAGVVFFPRNHYFRGMNITQGGFPELEAKNKSKLLGTNAIFTGNNVGLVKAQFGAEGKLVKLRRRGARRLLDRRKAGLHFALLGESQARVHRRPGPRGGDRLLGEGHAGIVGEADEARQGAAQGAGRSGARRAEPAGDPRHGEAPGDPVAGERRAVQGAGADRTRRGGAQGGGGGAQVPRGAGRQGARRRGGGALGVRGKPRRERAERGGEGVPRGAPGNDEG